MSGFEPNHELHVSLEARKWNALLTLANEGLGNLAAILSEVQRQCMQQQRPPMPEHMPMRTPGGLHRPNGEAPEPETDQANG